MKTFALLLLLCLATAVQAQAPKKDYTVEPTLQMVRGKAVVVWSVCWSLPRVMTPRAQAQLVYIRAVQAQQAFYQWQRGRR